MGYVSHIFMYMDIRKHINLIKNHGYEGKIGMIKKDVHGIVMLAAKAGDIVLYRPYKEDEEHKNISLRLFVGAFCLSLSKT